MKACKFCGMQVDNNINSCPSCGSKTFLHVCENCGKQFESAYCPNCGVKAGQEKKVCPQCRTTYFSNACPNCGYTGVKREPVQQTVVHKHVYVQEERPAAPAPPPVRQRRIGCGTVLLWILFPPIMATLAILRSRTLKPGLKILLVILFWGFLLGFTGNRCAPSTLTGTARRTASRTTSTPRVTATPTPRPTATPTPGPEVIEAQKAVDAYLAEQGAPGTITAYDASFKKGRGLPDKSYTVPDYLGAVGYAVVADDERLPMNDDYAATPWTVKAYQKDKQFWAESGTIPHKTRVVVIGQVFEDAEKEQ